MLSSKYFLRPVSFAATLLCASLSLTQTAMAQSAPQIIAIEIPSQSAEQLSLIHI
jgi:hypothetical protein